MIDLIDYLEPEPFLGSQASILGRVVVYGIYCSETKVKKEKQTLDIFIKLHGDTKVKQNENIK